MGKLSRAAVAAGRRAVAAGRGTVRLVAGGRRDWAEAVWAEAHEVPPGLPRLAWRAGAVWLMAREALMVYRPGRALLFAVAAAVAAWAAWPDSSAGHAAADQFGVIATVVLLAGLPLLARRFFGPVSDSRAARFLRVGGYAAILALMPAFAVVAPFPFTVPQSGVDLRVFYASGNPRSDLPGTSSGGPPWQGEIPLLLLTAGYVVAIGWVTSRRSRVAPATLAAGTGAGIVFGLVMYSVAPLGLSKDATNPWLPGSQIDPLVALAWILLFGVPVAAAGIAGWRYRGPGRSHPSADARIGQSVAAGVLANLVGALLVTVLGLGTIALTIKAPWLRPWVYHGQHLSAAAAYSHELAASGSSGNTGMYAVMCVIFPFIGLVMSPLGGLVWGPAAAAGQSGPPPGGGGPPGPEPTPDPPGGRLADPDGADEDRLTARSPSPPDQGRGSEDRRGTRALQPV
jgi:hypothetical protein